MWENEADMKSDQRRAAILVWFFAIFSILLLTSIILTIITSPGYIPEDTEWDMPMQEEDTLEQAAEELNQLQDQNDQPRDSNMSGIMENHNREVDLKKKLEDKNLLIDE